MDTYYFSFIKYILVKQNFSLTIELTNTVRRLKGLRGAGWEDITTSFGHMTISGTYDPTDPQSYEIDFAEHDGKYVTLLVQHAHAKDCMYMDAEIMECINADIARIQWEKYEASKPYSVIAIAGTANQLLSNPLQPAA